MEKENNKKINHCNFNSDFPCIPYPYKIRCNKTDNTRTDKILFVYRDYKRYKPV